MARRKQPQNQQQKQNAQQQQQQQKQQYNQPLQQNQQNADNYFETAEELTGKGKKEHGANKQAQNPEKGV